MSQIADSIIGRTPLLTVRDAADRLACSPQLVYAMAADGRLPSVKVGVLVRISSEDLDQFIEQRTRTEAQ